MLLYFSHWSFVLIFRMEDVVPGKFNKLKSPAVPSDENDKPTASPEGYYSDLFLPYFL